MKINNKVSINHQTQHSRGARERSIYLQKSEQLYDEGIVWWLRKKWRSKKWLCLAKLINEQRLNTELHRVRSLTEEGLFETDEGKADLRTYYI